MKSKLINLLKSDLKVKGQGQVQFTITLPLENHYYNRLRSASKISNSSLNRQQI